MRKTLPINGVCGVEQDTCRLGDPVNTGGTSQPYEWSCSGQYGGGFDACSVQHAATAEGEVFAGKNAFEERLKAAGPLRGLLAISDGTIEHPDCEQPYCHYYAMRRAATDMGIPEENLYMTAGVHERADPKMIERTRVIAYPTAVLSGFVDIHDYSAGEWLTSMRDWWYPGRLHVAAAGGCHWPAPSPGSMFSRNTLTHWSRSLRCCSCPRPIE